MKRCRKVVALSKVIGRSLVVGDKGRPFCSENDNEATNHRPHRAHGPIILRMARP
jgi:hypothetical protein